MDATTGVGEESVSLTWLEDAMKYAYAHGRMRSLAYLKAVMEDVVFVVEMAQRRKVLTDG